MSGHDDVVGEKEGRRGGSLLLLRKKVDALGVWARVGGLCRKPRPPVKAEKLALGRQRHVHQAKSGRGSGGVDVEGLMLVTATCAAGVSTYRGCSSKCPRKEDLGEEWKLAGEER